MRAPFPLLCVRGICLALVLLWPAVSPAQTPPASATPSAPPAPASEFTTPLAVTAEAKYEKAMTAGRDQYLQDLDAAMKAALQAGKLEEANGINELSKQITAGNLAAPRFQTAATTSARTKYLQAVFAAKQQYYRDLDGALKAAMAAANLNESNTINAARRRLVDESKPPAAASLTAPSQPPVSFGSPVAGVPTKSGLEVREYAREPSQVKANEWCILPEKFTKPEAKTFTITSLLGWKFNPDRNAIASGFLIVEQDGEYAFNSDSFWDRNSLSVDGVMVCPGRDGATKVAKIQLKKGYVPIVSVGMIETKGTVFVKWKPPGQAELSEIPPKLLKH